jgi:hypothetical protein
MTFGGSATYDLPSSSQCLALNVKDDYINRLIISNKISSASSERSNQRFASLFYTTFHMDIPGFLLNVLSTVFTFLYILILWSQIYYQKPIDTKLLKIFCYFSANRESFRMFIRFRPSSILS